VDGLCRAGANPHMWGGLYVCVGVVTICVLPAEGDLSAPDEQEGRPAVDVELAGPGAVPLVVPQLVPEVDELAEELSGERF
jgi:hypothetical protein